MPDDTMTQDTNTQTSDQTADTQQTSQDTGTLLSESDSSQQKTDQQTQTQDTVLTEPVSVLKPDMTFIDNWKDKLPEEFRNEECLELIKNSDGKADFNEMVKQFVNQRKAIGKNKVAIPTDKSDENEWNSFYEAIGRPKTHMGYNAPEIPEELKPKEE